jgi:hypothetical protein
LYFSSTPQFVIYDPPISHALNSAC